MRSPFPYLLVLLLGCGSADEAPRAGGEATVAQAPATPEAPAKAAPEAPEVPEAPEAPGSDSAARDVQTPPKPSPGTPLTLRAVGDGGTVLLLATAPPGFGKPELLPPPGTQILGEGAAGLGTWRWRVRPPGSGVFTYQIALRDGSALTTAGTTCCAAPTPAPARREPTVGHSSDGVPVMR